MKKLLHQLVLLMRYAAAATTALCGELVLLYILLHYAGLPYWQAVSIAFAIATSLNYLACHGWVFNRSRRRWSTEYLYFFIIVVSGLLLNLALVSVVVQAGLLAPVAARAVVSPLTGLWNFYINARFNFRSRAFLK